MGIKAAYVTPDLICRAMVQGRQSSQVIQGVPANAKILDIFTDFTQQEPRVVMIFESPDWETVDRKDVELTDIVLEANHANS
jgi:hypothetical protein